MLIFLLTVYCEMILLSWVFRSFISVCCFVGSNFSVEVAIYFMVSEKSGRLGCSGLLWELMSERDFSLTSDFDDFPDLLWYIELFLETTLIFGVGRLGLSNTSSNSGRIFFRVLHKSSSFSGERYPIFLAVGCLKYLVYICSSFSWLEFWWNPFSFGFSLVFN